MWGRRLLAAMIVMLAIAGGGRTVGALTLQQSGTVGLEGTVPSPPPTQGASITTPRSGQAFNQLPITVAGLCPNNLLVEVFDNGVMVGSTECNASSFSLKIDLFSGRNDLVAKVFDSLNQPGPDSGTVSVTFNDNQAISGPPLTITTAFAERGAAPGDTLTWPITLSGGVGPFAISVDWGDKSPADLISRQTAGDLNIEHVYSQSGIFSVIIKVTDAAGRSAFLQLVAVGTGNAAASTTAGGGPARQAASITAGRQLTAKMVAIIAAPTGVLLVSSFWLGRRHQLQVIKDHLRKGRQPL